MVRNLIKNNYLRIIAGKSSQPLLYHLGKPVLFVTAYSTWIEAPSLVYSQHFCDFPLPNLSLITLPISWRKPLS